MLGSLAGDTGDTSGCSVGWRLLEEGGLCRICGQ